MPMHFELTISNTDIAGIARKKVARALALGGKAWVSAARTYPPYPSGGLHTLTNSLAKSANFRVSDDGLMVEFLASTIFAYLLFGTGIYGPTGQRITSKSGKLLAIPVTNRVSTFFTSQVGMWSGKSGYVEMKKKWKKSNMWTRTEKFSPTVFARSVSGSIWAGKLEQTKTEIIDSIRTGLGSGE